MAVKIKHKGNSVNNYEILELFSVDQTIIAQLKALKVTIKVTPSKVLFERGILVVASMPINPGAISSMKAGKLGSMSVQVLGGSMQATAQKVINQYQNELPTAMSEPDITIIPMSEEGLSKHPANKKKAKAKAKVTQKSVYESGEKAPAKFAGMVCTETEMVQEPQTELRHATKLYEPVKGTSGGSRYHVIGLGDQFQVAARLKGHALSFRVEGDIAQNHDMLAEAGLNVSGDSHASLHLDCKTEQNVIKAVGALFMTLQVEFDTPMPIIKKLVGKGA